MSNRLEDAVCCHLFKKGAKVEDKKKYFKEALKYGKQSIYAPRTDAYTYGVSGETNYSQNLLGFIKKKTEKKVVISLKPIADWIDSSFAIELSKEYNNFFDCQSVTIG